MYTYIYTVYIYIIIYIHISTLYIYIYAPVLLHVFIGFEENITGNLPFTMGKPWKVSMCFCRFP